MSLSTLLLAVFLILWGVSTLGWIAVSSFILGILAFAAGVLLLIEAAHPITVYRRNP